MSQIIPSTPLTPKDYSNITLQNNTIPNLPSYSSMNHSQLPPEWDTDSEADNLPPYQKPLSNSPKPPSIKQERKEKDKKRRNAEKIRINEQRRLEEQREIEEQMINRTFAPLKKRLLPLFEANMDRNDNETIEIAYTISLFLSKPQNQNQNRKRTHDDK